MVAMVVGNGLGGSGEDWRNGEGAERDRQGDGYSHGNLLLMVTNGQFRTLFPSVDANSFWMMNPA